MHHANSYHVGILVEIPTKHGESLGSTVFLVGMTPISPVLWKQLCEIVSKRQRDENSFVSPFFTIISGIFHNE